MGVGISGASQEHDLDFNWHSWAWLRATGQQYGWKPSGTIQDPLTVRWMHEACTGTTITDEEVRRECEEWNGEYDSNDYQFVTAEDAKAWAAALSLALEDRLALCILEDGKPPDEETFAWFEPRARAFIAACLAGGFRVS